MGEGTEKGAHRLFQYNGLSPTVISSEPPTLERTTLLVALDKEGQP